MEGKNISDIWNLPMVEILESRKYGFNNTELKQFSDQVDLLRQDIREDKVVREQYKVGLFHQR